MIFINDSYEKHLASYLQHPTYSLYLLTHEILHFVEDWTGKPLVRDGVPPNEDREVMKTLNDFIAQTGGWEKFRRKYAQPQL